MKKTVRLIILFLVAAVSFVLFSFGANAETAVPEKPLTVDLDLSGMSGTIVYSQVYHLLYDPAPWIGKVIRMAGYYSAFQDTATGMVYHACVIPDATACCAQGIEFVWAGEHAWPENYPDEGSDIVVTGRLEIYDENGIKYLHLVDAELIWEQEASQ